MRTRQTSLWALEVWCESWKYLRRQLHVHTHWRDRSRYSPPSPWVWWLRMYIQASCAYSGHTREHRTSPAQTTPPDKAKGKAIIISVLFEGYIQCLSMFERYNRRMQWLGHTRTDPENTEGGVKNEGSISKGIIWKARENIERKWYKTWEVLKIRERITPGSSKEEEDHHKPNPKHGRRWTQKEDECWGMCGVLVAGSLNIRFKYPKIIFFLFFFYSNSSSLRKEYQKTKQNKKVC